MVFNDADRKDCPADKAKFITYDASTSPGVSGAPIFVDGHLVGVHVEGVSSHMYNRGELLAPHLN